MQIISMLIGVLALICWILVLIKQFQNAGVVHGVIGIITCSIWTFIWGWINARKLNLTNIMLVWTVLCVLDIIMNLMFGTMYTFMPQTPAAP